MTRWKKYEQEIKHKGKVQSYPMNKIIKQKSLETQNIRHYQKISSLPNQHNLLTVNLFNISESLRASKWLENSNWTHQWVTAGPQLEGMLSGRLKKSSLVSMETIQGICFFSLKRGSSLCDSKCLATMSFTLVSICIISSFLPCSFRMEQRACTNQEPFPGFLHE